MINGAVLGYVFSRVYVLYGASDFWRILPHGIFELPAIFIALGLGVKLGFFIFSGNIKQEFLRRFYYSFLVFLFVVVPLLIIAAIIEGLLITIIG
jgi:stage II sporulation protein M